MDGKTMKETRIKAARHIVKQCQKVKTIPNDAMFDADMVDLSDILDDDRYYERLIFVHGVAAQYIKESSKTCAADVALCEVLGPQFYSTSFGVVTYDTNKHLLPLLSAQFGGAEFHEYWKGVFEEYKKTDGFNISRKTTIVYQEKSIGSAYKEVFEHTKMFLDPMHVHKNMGSSLCAHRTVNNSLSDRSLNAPSQAAVGDIASRYSGKKQV